jgi:hypothetical protein
VRNWSGIRLIEAGSHHLLPAYSARAMLPFTLSSTVRPEGIGFGFKFGNRIPRMGLSKHGEADQPIAESHGRLERWRVPGGI